MIYGNIYTRTQGRIQGGGDNRGNCLPRLHKKGSNVPLEINGGNNFVHLSTFSYFSHSKLSIFILLK